LVNYAGAVFSTVSALWAIPALAAFAVSAGAGKRYEMEARPFAAAGTAARHILAPAVLPAALAAAGFAFILAVGEYSIPALWQIDTYPTRVLMLYSAYFEPQLAAAASIAPLVVTAAAAVAVFASASKALSQSDVERAQADESVLWRPGRASGSVLVATCCLFVGVPLAASAYWTVSDWTGFGALGAVGEDFLHTFFVAGLAALCAAIAGVLVPALWWADGRRAARGALWLCVAAFLMPATGAALAVKALVQWDMVPAFVGDSTLTLSYALAGRYAAIPLVLAVLALSRIDRQFIHLANACGVARSPRLIVAFAPVILGAGVAGGIVALVLGVSELPMSMILAPAGRPPVAVDLFNLMHYARQGQAFAAAIMMMVGASAAVLAAFSMAAGTWKRYLSAA
jgi:iron(III) transport system permease protein